MRMFRLPSWISESRSCDKVADGEVNIKMANATRPVVEILPGGVPRRKRSLSLETTGAAVAGIHDAKRQKLHSPPSQKSQVNGLDKTVQVDANEKVTASSSRIRDIIESQFSLEILLKHDELRLINQELAKCQVALEQLRRCHLIPYPTTQQTPGSMLNITNGTGPAVASGSKIPQWAPAFGVADGPYSRHYARWLIPDPSFDGVEVEWHGGFEGSYAGKTVPEGRSTRHSMADGTPTTSKSRNQRGSMGQKLQALSSGYPQTKDKVGPCTLRRGDGQMVKLVCVDCNRENFSSTQGFINHCRIAHKREFKSHEEAAVVCGHVIEVDEAGGIVGEEKSPATVTTGRTLVHPLISSTPTDPAAYKALLSRIDASMSLFQQGRLPGITAIPSSAKSTAISPTPATQNKLVPSLDAPHLSSLMHRKGFGGDLPEIISDAKKHVGFEELSSHDEESDENERPVHEAQRCYSGTELPPAIRVPARAVMSPAPFHRPSSSKGPDAINARKPGQSGISPRLPPATPVIDTSGSAHQRPDRLSHYMVDRFDHSPEVDADTEMTDGSSVAELSPHTVASNNAPSLVSDDGEYDDGDDAESAASEEEEDNDSVAEIDIEDDGVDKVVPRTVLRNRAGSGGDSSMRLRKEEKHVTFVSPVKESNKERRRN